MALSGNVTIDITQLREGDGSLKMALELWSIRNGPAPYNVWQSVYYELLREHGYEDEYWVQRRQLAKDLPKERQARIRNLWNEIQAELHGPDHQVASLIRGRQDKARAQEEREHPPQWEMMAELVSLEWSEAKESCWSVLRPVAAPRLWDYLTSALLARLRIRVEPRNFN